MTKEQLQACIDEKRHEIHVTRGYIDQKANAGDFDSNAMFERINVLNEEIKELNTQLSHLSLPDGKRDNDEMNKAMSILHGRGGTEIRPDGAQDEPAKYYNPLKKTHKKLLEEYNNQQKVQPGKL